MVHSAEAPTIVEIDVLAEQTPEHLLELRQRLVQVDDSRLEHLSPAEREQLPGQLGAPPAGLLDLRDVLPQRVARREGLEGQRRVAEDDRQHVVEVMRDAAREPPDGLHLLGLAELLLQRPLLRHVLRVDDHPAAIADIHRVARHVGLDERPVLLPVPPDAVGDDCRPGGSQDLQQPGHLLRSADVCRRHLQHLFARVAVVTDGRVVDGDEPQRRQVEHPGGDRAAVEESAVLLLGLPERLFAAAKLLLDLLSLGHVAVNAEIAEDLAALVEDRIGRRLDVDPPAVLGLVDHRHGHDLLLLQPGPELLVERGVLRSGFQQARSLADGLGARVAVEPLEGRVDVRDRAIRRGHEDRVARALDAEPELEGPRLGRLALSLASHVPPTARIVQTRSLHVENSWRLIPPPASACASRAPRSARRADSTGAAAGRPSRTRRGASRRRTSSRARGCRPCSRSRCRRRA